MRVLSFSPRGSSPGYPLDSIVRMDIGSEQGRHYSSLLGGYFIK